MGERSYLAIGDVLALLREEFPDVTISKIRFLESRGLLVPERTPSGYRKFYEPDVDRLRWILRQQREHFLPLKVIKGRLENGMSDPDATAPPLFEMGDPPPEQGREREPEAVLVGAPGAAEATQEGASPARAPRGSISVVGSPGNGAPSREDAPGLAELDSAPPSSDESLAEPGTAREGEAGARKPAAGRAPGERSKAVDDTAPATVQSPPGASSEPGPAPKTPKAPKTSGAQGAPPGPGEQARPAGHGEAGGLATRASTRSTAGLPGAGLSGASMTLTELASASGLDVAGVVELESFGLIAGRTVAGVHCYDEGAVVVAKLAARFSPYGLEARHLRIFKHAADRQTGLFAQVVTPLLRQRNPEARARAIEDLSELTELGEALMRCFSQATLRELTGG